MLCQEAQLYLHDIADSRPLSGAIQDAVSTHIAGCETCRQELELTRFTKSQLAARMAAHPLPHSTESAVRTALALEAQNLIVCRVAQEHLHDIADERHLLPAIYDEVTSHVEGCESCRQELELARSTKSLLAARMAALAVPHVTQHAVKTVTEMEASLEDTLARINSPYSQMEPYKRTSVPAVVVATA